MTTEIFNITTALILAGFIKGVIAFTILVPIMLLCWFVNSLLAPKTQKKGKNKYD